MRPVSIVLSTPGAAGLGEAVRALRGWQYDGAPVQLHPGDLGWHQRFGAQKAAAAVRTWSQAGQIRAVGLVDSPGVFRLAADPVAQRDRELAERLAADLSQPGRGALPPGRVSVEARFDGLLPELLRGAGWTPGEHWTPLRRDLADPVEPVALRVEVTGPERAPVRAAVQRAAFSGSTFSVEGWHAMAAGPAYADARCLVGYDEHGAAVAAATVWSAGPGRPGLLEPVGVHAGHRGHRYGTAISVAAAAALRDLGSSSAIVCTPSANTAAVATYRSAGFVADPEAPDLDRAAQPSGDAGPPA